MCEIWAIKFRCHTLFINLYCIMVWWLCNMCMSIKGMLFCVFCKNQRVNIWYRIKTFFCKLAILHKNLNNNKYCRQFHVYPVLPVFLCVKNRTRNITNFSYIALVNLAFFWEKQLFHGQFHLVSIILDCSCQK